MLPQKEIMNDRTWIRKDYRTINVYELITHKKVPLKCWFTLKSYRIEGFFLLREKLESVQAWAYITCCNKGEKCQSEQEKDKKIIKMVIYLHHNKKKLELELWLHQCTTYMYKKKMTWFRQFMVWILRTWMRKCMCAYMGTCMFR